LGFACAYSWQGGGPEFLRRWGRGTQAECCGLLGIRRLTRLTNAFSKKLANLKAAIALHFAYYNFCRIHQTLRVTPAMEAGLTDHVWELKELLAA